MFGQAVVPEGGAVREQISQLPLCCHKGWDGGYCEQGGSPECRC